MASTTPVPSGRGTSPSAPALLRCHRIVFPTHEQFGRRDMRALGVSLVFWAGFLRSSRTFSKSFQVDLLGQRKQGRHHLSRTHGTKDTPFLLRNGDHHPLIGDGEFVGNIVE